MPDDQSAGRARDRLHALLIVCVLAVASVVIAFLGVAPAAVSASEALGTARTPGDAAFIASHRGGGATAPENTLPAIEAALAAGFDYVEVDVALTLDHQPVLMHDPTVDRTTDGHGPLAALTLAQVRRLDAGSWFDERFAGAKVPTLGEFLDVLDASGHRAIVEFKGAWSQDAVTAAVGQIGAHDLERRIAISSFDTRTLAMVGAASAVVPRLLILKHIPDDVVRATADAGVCGIVVNRKALLKRPDVVEELHAADVRVIAYTLNKHTQWDAVTALGVDGIVTDEPGTLSHWQHAAARQEG